MLKEKGLVSEAQISAMKAKMETWHSSIKPSVNWMLIIIALVVLVIMAAIFIRMRKPAVPPSA
jgi:type II secretory pathway component PulF